MYSCTCTCIHVHAGVHEHNAHVYTSCGVYFLFHKSNSLINILYGPHCCDLRNRPISDNSSYVRPMSSFKKEREDRKIIRGQTITRKELPISKRKIVISQCTCRCTHVY